MHFEWDETKNQYNIEKHGISFERAITIFSGTIVSTIDGRRDYDELRMQTIGSMEGAIIILVVHTDRNGATRVISARPASRKERKDYEEFTR